MALFKKDKKAEGIEVLKAKCVRLWQQASNSRKRLDWKWFTYDLWVSGEHYSRWDKQSQQVVAIQSDRNKPRVVINKVYTTLRSVRNYVLRNRPKPEVTPYNMTEDMIDEAVKGNKYLDFLHDRLNLRMKLKESLWHALKYSAGWWQILWDEDGEDGKGEIAVNVIDPYDLYWDPTARSVNEARYCILAVRKSIEDLKEDSKYDQEAVAQVKPDKQLSSSTLKSRLLEYEVGNQGGSQDSETVIVKEFWLKENKPTKDKENKVETMIRLVTTVNDIIIRNEETELNKLPFFKLSADIEPLSLYGQGWVKNIIPVNKLLNKLQSQLAEYNDILNRGKIIADKGAGFRVINNENGQIIEKKRGYDITQMGIAPLSSAIYQQISDCDRYIEDMGGAHDASMGRIPTGAHSGRALEALQVGDSNNMSEIVENTEQFLEDTYEYILYLASKKYQFIRNIIPTNQSGEREFIKIIGEDAAKRMEIDPQEPGAPTVIREKNMVDVKITSWLANTAEARREVLKELYQLQAIDQQTLLEGYSIGSVADVIKRTKQQKLEEIATQQATEQDSAALDVAKNQATQPPEAPAAGPQEAIANIRQILTGQQPTIPMNVGQDYIAYLDDFMQTPEFQQVDPALQQHIQGIRDQLASNPNVNQFQPSPSQMTSMQSGMR